MANTYASSDKQQRHAMLEAIKYNSVNKVHVDFIPVKTTCLLGKFDFSWNLCVSLSDHETDSQTLNQRCFIYDPSHVL